MTGLPPEAYTRSGEPQAAESGTLMRPTPGFVNWAMGNPGGISGPVVNELTALHYHAVYCCVSLIAGTIAALPLLTYRRTGRGRVRATELSAYRVLHDEYNPDTSAPVGREAMIGHLLTWGNAYSQIIRSKSGTNVLALQNLAPDLTTPYRAKSGELRYEVKDRATGDVAADFGKDEVLHVPAIGFDGIMGYSPIRMAKAVIRAGMAQDNEAEKFVTRGIRPPGGIKLPPGKNLGTQQAADRWRDTFRKLHASEDSQLNIIVLEDGADWVKIGIDPEDAQLLESRQLSFKQVAGLYRVPPHLIGDVEATSSWGTGIAEQVAGFIKLGLLPWVNKLEKEKNRKLFGPGSDVYCEHLMEGLERADIEKRTKALIDQITHGMRSPNEAREVENLNPAEGMDFYLYPLNYGRVDEDGKDIPPPAPIPAAGKAEPKTPAPAPAGPDKKDTRDFILPVCRAWLGATSLRLLKREAGELARMAAKPDSFVKKAGDFYDGHAKTVADEYATVFREWPGEPNAGAFAAAHVARSRAELLATLAAGPGDLAAAVKELTDSWLVSRPAEVSRADV